MVYMRKGKTPEDRLIHVYDAHLGPVRAIQRNPMFIKNFLTVGDNTTRIFAEDCKESSIMWTAPKVNHIRFVTQQVHLPSSAFFTLFFISHPSILMDNGFQHVRATL